MGTVPVNHEFHCLHRSRNIAARQAESSPTATTEVIPTSTTLSDPGATFTPASVAFNYSLPPDTQMWPLDNQTGPLTVRCANCSTAGTLMLVDAGFTVGNLFDDVGSGKFSNIYFQLQANGLYAIVSLNATTTNSSVVTEEVPIRGIGNSTDTFDILDLFSLSFTRGLGIELGASLAANIDMAFGFEVMVPDNSTITFALEDLFLPDVTGFEQTNFSALPFTSHVSDLELTLFARAFADIGFAISTDLFDSQAVEADAYIDMPNLQLDLTPVKNVDVNCQPAAAAQQSAGSSFDALELSLQFGLAAGVDFDNKNVTGFNQTIGTPTACLAFDEAKGSIVPAASVARNAASASTTSAAAPMAMGVRFGALEVSQGILIAVAVAVGATAVVL
ncbi:hypothetical protein MMC10_011423 [Thelotrema lepadinum]|nr:hypothetical protein [Thelotrema lepadinum]